ncbi:MAG: GyrI-like domain-containing protein [Bacteroidia bacterium]|nr:GyrI-like domain-containing protein [Bacteroidia bacterium]
MAKKLLPRIEQLEEKKLIGQSLKMSLTYNKTTHLWRQFVPRIKEIQGRSSADKISMQIYPPLYYQEFNPNKDFEKWAAVEVLDLKNIPEGMKSFVLEGGLYAVFDYNGSSSDNSIFQYIFSEWLPPSAYVIDERPHFEVLGSGYKNNDPNSQEEIWIPIKQKSILD